LIYQENCFFFSRCDELINFKATIPRSHFNQIRKIRISLMLARYSDHVDQSFDPKTLAQLCTTLSQMHSLEDLFVDFDATHTGFRTNILIWMCTIMNAKNFTVVERQTSVMGDNHVCRFTRGLAVRSPYKYECYSWNRLSRVQARDSYVEVLYP
jgi:hypothetical protein